MNDGIDTSIGGNATERTARGFAIYGSVTDNRGSVTRVQRSSAMGEPRAWVFCVDAEGRMAYTFQGKPNAPAPHLDAAQARELAAALLRFADDAESSATAPIAWGGEDDGR